MGFSLGSWVIAETGHSPTSNRPFCFHEWTSLRVSLSKAYPTQNLTWEPGVPGSGCRSLGRSRRDGLLGPLGLEDPQTGWGVTTFQRPTPRQVKAWWPPGIPQTGVCGSLRSPVWPVLGRIRRLDIIEYFPPKASYFLVVSPEDCRVNLVGLDGAQGKSMKQEGRGQSTTFERIT